MQDKFFLYFGLAVISLPTYLLIAMIQFGNLTKFWDCILTICCSGPGDYYSAGLSWAKFKLIYFVCLCAGAVYGESALLIKFFPNIAGAIEACAKGIILFKL